MFQMPSTCRTASVLDHSSRFLRVVESSSTPCIGRLNLHRLLNSTALSCSGPHAAAARFRRPAAHTLGYRVPSEIDSGQGPPCVHVRFCSMSYACRRQPPLTKSGMKIHESAKKYCVSSACEHRAASPVQRRRGAGGCRQLGAALGGKTQIHAGGRGKGGGVKLARSIDECSTAASSTSACS